MLYIIEGVQVYLNNKTSMMDAKSLAAANSPAGLPGSSNVMSNSNLNGAGSLFG